MPKQPGAKLKQQFQQESSVETEFLPTLVVGPRYDLLHYPEDKSLSLLTTYDGNDNDNHDYDYPEKNDQSIMDTSSVALYGEQVDLKYYDSVSEGSTWRKVGNSSNKLRTLLSSGLIFTDDSEGLFPHSNIFNDRGVLVGDTIIVESGTEKTTTQVIGFEADKSTAAIGVASANSGNKTAQSNAIGSATAGGANSTASTVTASAGTYTGSLLQNVLSDTYSIRVVAGGTAPSIFIDASGSSSTLVVATNDFYDFAGVDVYTIEALTTGALETATYRITSQSGVDNTGTTTTPAIDTLVDLNSRGTQFEFTGSGTVTAGDKWVISIVPSTARLQITTTSGTDNSLNRVFPGYDVAFSISGEGRGVKITVAENSSANLSLNDRWTIAVAKEVEKVSGTSGGTFTGKLDINYLIEVVQGGAFGECAISVRSTADDSQSLISVAGSGSGNTLSIGDYGATFFFASNSQGGLIEGDIFTFTAVAAKNTSNKIILVKDSLPVEADDSTVGSAVYTGSNGTPNTGTSGGVYDPSLSNALHLNDTEVYTISVKTIGAYGVAEIGWTSSSGLDDSSEDVLIPASEGEEISIGVAGATIAFTGEEDFALTDSWTITVSKVDLDVKLLIRKETVTIPNKRQNNPALDAWVPNAENVTINSGICLIESTWSSVECLPIESGQIYVEYKALNPVGSNLVDTVENITEVVSLLGKNHIDNPIVFGLHAALLGASEGDVPGAISYVTVETDDIDGYLTALDQLELRNESQVYRIAPMSGKTEILEAVEAHVNKMSTEVHNKWRMMICSTSAPAVLDVVGTSSSSSYTATVVENPSDPGKFTLLKTTDADFSGVQTGDVAVYLGKEYIVSAVSTPKEIILKEGLNAAQTVPATLYIYHIPTKQDLIDLFKFYGENFGNRRVVNIVPDKFIRNGSEIPGYYVAAFLAGLKSAILPHQPLTNFEISYVDEAPLSLRTFKNDDLEEISDGGNLVIQQDAINTVPYIRQQLTTDLTEIKTQEWSITENFDELSYLIINEVKEFIGKYNLHTGVLAQIETNLSGALFTKTEVENNQAGSQIVDFQIVRLEANPNKVDELLVEVAVSLPSPLNFSTITVVASSATV